MFIFVAKDGQVRAVVDKADLKTPFKYAGWEGRAFEVTATPVDLEGFRPVEKGSAPSAASVALSAEVATLKAQNAELVDAVKALLAAQKAAPAAPAK